VEQHRERDCPFCALPNEMIVESHPLAVVKRDSFPVTQGHSLIIPRRHVQSFFESTEEERLAILVLLQRAKSLLDEQYRPDGYNVGINDGAVAGQTIMHVHVHLIPRYRGDSDDPRGGIRCIFPDKAAYWKRQLWPSKL
jgi:diadenosine tetraphosphate (Ap4A) HIT family hydrolase